MSEVKAKVGVDGAPFKRGLDDLRGNAKSFASNLKYYFRDSFSVFSGTALFSMAKGAFDGLKKLLSTPIKLAAEEEQLVTALEVLTGSAETAKQVFEGFADVAAKTPFEFPEVADAGRKLLAFGSSASSVNGELKKMSDISSATGVNIGELAELYGKARVQGTLFSEDINQMTGRGIPVIEEFAKILGVSTGEVKTLASEGKITFAELEEAFTNLTSEGGRFADMSAKQSATLTGLWSTFKDEVAGAMRALGKPVADWLKPIIEGWTSALKEVFNVVKGAIANGDLTDILVTSLDIAATTFRDGFLNAIRAGIDYLQAGADVAADKILNGLIGMFPETAKKFGMAKIEDTSFESRLSERNSVTSADMMRLQQELDAKKARLGDLWTFSQKTGEGTGAAGSALSLDAAGVEQISGLDKAKAELMKKQAEMAYDAASNEEKINILKARQIELQALANDNDVAGIEAKSELLDIEEKMLAIKQAMGRNEEKAALERQREDERKAKEASTNNRPEFSGVVSRLQRIGGGGGISSALSDPAQREREKQSKLLEQIARNTKGQPGQPDGGMAP